MGRDPEGLSGRATSGTLRFCRTRAEENARDPDDLTQGSAQIPKLDQRGAKRIIGSAGAVGTWSSR